VGELRSYVLLGEDRPNEARARRGSSRRVPDLLTIPALATCPSGQPSSSFRGLGGLGEGLVGYGEQVVTAIADASERMRAVAAQEVGDQNSLGEVVVTPFALTSAVYVDVKAFHTWGTPRPNSAGPGLSNS